MATQICNSQNDFSKKGIKRINYTESYTQLLSDGKQHISIIETLDTVYDEDGQKLSSLRTIYDKSLPKSKNQTTFYYNNSNLIAYSISHIDNDSIQIKTQYYYNNELLVKKQFDYIRNEKETKFKETYNYNSKDKLSSSNYIYYEKYIDSDIDDFITYVSLKEKYDRKERTVEMDWTGSDKKYKHNRFEYKWKKRKLLKTEKEFDNNNKLISKSQFEYTFDDKNNWIVKQEIRNNVLYKISYREIEYY